MKKTIFVIMAILILLSFTACFDSNSVVRIVAPVAYGNGVYYFHCTGEEFGTSLSKFIADGNKKVVAIAGDGNGGYSGYDIGYFVVVDTTTVTGGHNADN